jgi:hypothetical protein
VWNAGGLTKAGTFTSATAPDAIHDALAACFAAKAAFAPFLVAKDAFAPVCGSRGNNAFELHLLHESGYIIS